MSDIEKSWAMSLSRRNALASVAGFMAASPIGMAWGELDPGVPLDKVIRIKTIGEMRTTLDFQPAFIGNLPASITEYTAHGDGSEFNLRRNRQAFDWIDIVSNRPAVQASQVDLSTELFGAKMKFPIMVGPSSGQNGLHPEGEGGMFKGATAASVPMILTGAAGGTITKLTTATTGGTMWSQHYPEENLPNDARALGGIEGAGSQCVVLTCDQSASVYERTLLIRHLGGRVSQGGGAPGEGGGNGAAASAAAAAAKAAAGGPPVPGSVKYRVSDRRLWYSWQYVDSVRKVLKNKLMIKGIVDAEDARMAVEHGADAILVSNHGGRSMDYGPATLEVLPEIVAAVNGRIPVVFDSGIRRGSDIFKALALGASAVSLGRTARWGLGAYGSAGVQRVLEILQQELIETAAAAGCAKLSDINKSMVKINFP
jgi:isopentenyl diphosphate isomerase/L-lactate dehydrogenase-like FMN-dependent dehydrogenase